MPLIVEVTGFRADDKSNVIDAKHGGSGRSGDRAVTWLVVAFVSVAVLVLGFAIAQSRTRQRPESNGPAHVTATPPNEGFRVARILDGDTIIVVGQDNIELTLRLAGIDAPEKDQPFGDAAAKFLEGLLHEHVVQIDNVKREKYGRLLAHAYLGSRSVDLEMVQHGWAWVYPGTDSRVLRDAEAKARMDKAGLWSSDSARPPWEWRKDGH